MIRKRWEIERSIPGAAWLMRKLTGKVCSSDGEVILFCSNHPLFTFWQFTCHCEMATQPDGILSKLWKLKLEVDVSSRENVLCRKGDYISQKLSHEPVSTQSAVYKDEMINSAVWNLNQMRTKSQRTESLTKPFQGKLRKTLSFRNRFFVKRPLSRSKLDWEKERSKKWIGRVPIEAVSSSYPSTAMRTRIDLCYLHRL